MALACAGNVRRRLRGEPVRAAARRLPQLPAPVRRRGDSHLRRVRPRPDPRPAAGRPGQRPVRAAPPHAGLRRVVAAGDDRADHRPLGGGRAVRRTTADRRGVRDGLHRRYSVGQGALRGLTAWHRRAPGRPRAHRGLRRRSPRRRAARAVGPRPRGPAVRRAPCSRRRRGRTASPSARDPPARRRADTSTASAAGVRLLDAVPAGGPAAGALGLRQRDAGVHDPSGARRAVGRCPGRRTTRAARGGLARRGLRGPAVGAAAARALGGAAAAAPARRLSASRSSPRAAWSPRGRPLDPVWSPEPRQPCCSAPDTACA